jgi:hypothetical protein
MPVLQSRDDGKRERQKELLKESLLEQSPILEQSPTLEQ